MSKKTFKSPVPVPVVNPVGIYIDLSAINMLCKKREKIPNKSLTYKISGVPYS